MKKTILLTVLLLQALFAWSQGFRNPVLPGFHADSLTCLAGQGFLFIYRMAVTP